MEETNSKTAIDLHQLAQQADVAFADYTVQYQRTHKPIVQPKAFGIKSVGPLFWFIAFEALNSIILAASRTVPLFATVASADFGGVMDFRAWLLGMVAFMVVEVGIITLTVILRLRWHQDHKDQPKKKRTLKKNATRMQVIWFNVTSSFWFKNMLPILGIVVLVVISGTAGFGQSVGLVKNIDQQVQTNIQWMLTYVIGIGASFIAFMYGDMMAEQIVLRMVDHDEAMKRFKRDDAAYQTRLRKAWEESLEYKQVYADLLTSDRVTSVNKLRRTARRAKAYAEKPIVVPEKTQKIMDFIVRILNETRDLPAVTAIVTECGVSKSTASSTRKAWEVITAYVKQSPAKPEIAVVMKDCSTDKIKITKVIAHAVLTACEKVQVG